METPSSSQQEPKAPTPAPTPAGATKFWTWPKIAGAVVAAWLLLMVLNSVDGGGSAESLATEETWRDTDPAGTILDPGYAAAEAELAPAAEPAAEETGVSAKEMIETELSNSVVY